MLANDPWTRVHQRRLSLPVTSGDRDTTALAHIHLQPRPLYRIEGSQKLQAIPSRTRGSKGPMPRVCVDRDPADACLCEDQDP
jgi:hypothetical protein